MKLFKKPKSKFYWYDFTVRGHRYRASSQETKSVRALQMASLRLASVRKERIHFQPNLLFSGSLQIARNGWRLLKSTSVAMLVVDQITGDCAEQLKFPGSAANANCALRTLRRMLHKAEEWKMIGHAPKIKMMKEHGRHLRLHDESGKETGNGSFGLLLAPANSVNFSGTSSS